MNITAVANDNGYRFRTIENAKAKGIYRSRLIPISRTCPMCGSTEVRKYPEDGIKMYQRGALVQDAFPDADASEREWFISGFCDKCQDILFAEPDEEEYSEEDEDFQPTFDDCSFEEYLEELDELDADVDPDKEFQFLNK